MTDEERSSLDESTYQQISYTPIHQLWQLPPHADIKNNQTVAHSVLNSVIESNNTKTLVYCTENNYLDVVSDVFKFINNPDLYNGFTRPYYPYEDKVEDDDFRLSILKYFRFVQMFQFVTYSSLNMDMKFKMNDHLETDF